MPHYVTVKQAVGGAEALILLSDDVVKMFLPDWTGQMNHQEAAAALDELEAFVRRSRELLAREVKPPRRRARWPASLHTQWGMHKRSRPAQRGAVTPPLPTSLWPRRAS